jgi:hypothetical protein
MAAEERKLMASGAGAMARGGATVAGCAIGVLMLETRFPRIPGDVGNAATFTFPVLYRVVHGASPDRVVRKGGEGLVEAFTEAGRELVRMGAQGLTTSCGFLSLHQRRLAEATGVPVAASALLQVPWVRSLLPPDRPQVGIVTVDASSLTPDHLAAVGLPPDVPIVGVDPGSEFARVFLGNHDTLDVPTACRDVVSAALRLVETYPNVGAIVLECTNMPPYRDDVRAATGRPVFDIVSLVAWFHHGLKQRARWDVAASAT